MASNRVRAIIKCEGKILFGINREGYYTLPGGKVNLGEELCEALEREVWEETGLKTKITDYHFIGHICDNYVYHTTMHDIPLTNKHDPDKEFVGTIWINEEKAKSGSLKMCPYTRKIMTHYYEIAYKSAIAKLKREDSEYFIEASCEGTYCLMWPVSLLGETDYHITLKYFGEQSDEKNLIEKIQNIIKDKDIKFDLENAKLIPKMFGKNKDVYVLQLLCDTSKLHELHNLFDEVRADDFSYNPHITVPEELWSAVLKYDLKLDDLDFKAESLILASNDRTCMAFGASDQTVLDYAKEVAAKLTSKYFPIDSAPIIKIGKFDGFGLTKWLENEKQPIVFINEQITDQNQIRSILAHELIHCHLFKKYQGAHTFHGPEFKEIADRINREEGDNYVAVLADETAELDEAITLLDSFTNSSTA